MSELTNGENADIQLCKQKITDGIATVTINSKKLNIYCLFYNVFHIFLIHETWFSVIRMQKGFSMGKLPSYFNYCLTKALSQVPYFFFTNCGLRYSSSANIPHPSMLYPPPSSPFIEIQPGIQALPLSWHQTQGLGDKKEGRELKWKQEYIPISQLMSLCQTVNRFRWI